MQFKKNLKKKCLGNPKLLIWKERRNELRKFLGKFLGIFVNWAPGQWIQIKRAIRMNRGYHRTH